MKPEVNRERAKLKYLQVLAEPDKVVFGATMTQIGRIRYEGQFQNEYVAIPAMEREGLVERRVDPLNIKSRPVFITPKGRQYLAEAANSEFFRRMVDRGELRADDSLESRNRDPEGDAIRHATAEWLRRLPEFQGSSEERIMQVSLLLAETIRGELNKIRMVDVPPRDPGYDR